MSVFIQQLVLRKRAIQCQIQADILARDKIIAAALGQGFASGTAAFVPFIDKVATGTSESVSFIYSADFTARVKVRRGDTIQPFETTFAVGSAGGSTNAIRTLDI